MASLRRPIRWIVRLVWVASSSSRHAPRLNALDDPIEFIFADEEGIVLDHEVLVGDEGQRHMVVEFDINSESSAEALSTVQHAVDTTGGTGRARRLQPSNCL